jgi:hypothetical protein
MLVVIENVNEDMRPFKWREWERGTTSYHVTLTLLVIRVSVLDWSGPNTHLRLKSNRPLCYPNQVYRPHGASPITYK